MSLQGTRVAIVATDGFEEAELSSPRQAMQAQGIEVDIVAPEGRQIRAWAETDWGDSYDVDKTITEVKAADYDALMLPGGHFNPDTLRTNEKVINFVRSFFEARKPVGAICHAPWILINADVVQGRTLTSVPSISQDLKNAGAKWVDQEVVVDNGLVTSRTPKDLDAFNAKLIEEIGEGKHRKQHA